MSASAVVLPLVALPGAAFAASAHAAFGFSPLRESRAGSYLTTVTLPNRQELGHDLPFAGQ